MSGTLLSHLSFLNSSGIKIILASASPRRKELLQIMGIKDFDVMVSNFPENLDLKMYHRQASQYCLHTAEEKVMNVAKLVAHSKEYEGRKVVIIGADTVVALDDVILEKPSDKEDSKRMLGILSGREHEVHTGVILYTNFLCNDAATMDSVASLSSRFVETSKVRFATLTPEDIDAYAGSGEGLDKAGSYGIQGLGGQLVQGIAGCYFNVMGLPVHDLSCALADLLTQYQQQQQQTKSSSV